eukprot:SAG22_NODE_437_length_10501_cov_3.019804_2_plen_41_part_00
MLESHARTFGASSSVASVMIEQRRPFRQSPNVAQFEYLLL